MMESWAEIVLQAWTASEEGREVADPAVCEMGGMYLSGRMARLADRCAQRVLGDFVEIGCWEGATTVPLAMVAMRHGRRVIAIDPWDGTGRGRAEGYQFFLEAIEPVKDVIDIWQTHSEAPEAIARLAGRPLAFAFIDGLHTYEGVASDLKAVAHCKGLIACDDCNWNEGIRRAIRESGKPYLGHGGFREVYVLPALAR